MTRRRNQVVYVNGRMVPSARARISVFDRGLLYSDGVFETVRAYRGVPFALREHLGRLRTSADFLGIGLPACAWRRAIAALLHRNGLTDSDAWVRITVTRGVAAPALVPPVRIAPTVLITAGSIDPSIATSQQTGVRVTLLPFARHGFLSEHKVLDYLPAVLGKTIAARHRAFEGVYVDESGRITEGTTSNVFVWRRHQLVTPPPAGILPGVTRRLVMRAAAAAGLRVRERPLRIADLRGADEAFLTSSLAEVVPITDVDGRPIGSGQIGPQTLHIQGLYRQTVDRARRRHARK
jgi:branched-subunit amino acid aminotransferase/4-amino-4-deoxychorismate lyase